MTQTPVAYIVFNRPQHTEKTFAVLREQRPSQLFIIADGPRAGHPTDEQHCAAVRGIVTNVDWPCEVHRKFADSNLGLKKNVSQGLDWVFGQVERAIVLEDDCLPHPDFFRFCETLLDRYAYEERVSVITGQNLQFGRQRGHGAYYFSKYPHCWGWATWRRAWQYYQGDLPFWPEWSQSDDWRKKTPDIVERRYWCKIFEHVRAEQIDSWAYPWMGSVWYYGGLTATPNVNLVSNIGFGPESTHTGSVDSPLACMPAEAVGSLDHFPSIEKNSDADSYVFNNVYGGKRSKFPLVIVFGILKMLRLLKGKLLAMACIPKC